MWCGRGIPPAQCRGVPRSVALFELWPDSPEVSFLRMAPSISSMVNNCGRHSVGLAAGGQLDPRGRDSQAATGTARGGAFAPIHHVLPCRCDSCTGWGACYWDSLRSHHSCHRLVLLPFSSVELFSRDHLCFHLGVSWLGRRKRADRFRPGESRPRAQAIRPWLLARRSAALQPRVSARLTKGAPAGRATAARHRRPGSSNCPRWSAGMRPARTRDDLPEPDKPNIATNRFRAKRSKRSSTCR